jgi:ANTAR domain
VQVAARISELEADLVDEKIADRVSGLLNADNLNGDAIEVIERHVEKVVGARQFGQILEDLQRELEDRIAERSLTAQAKTVLQVEHGMSEQQAYLHLRIASRRSRKRIGDVAQQIIKSREASKGHG